MIRPISFFESRVSLPLLSILSWITLPNTAVGGTFTDAPGAYQGDLAIHQSFLQGSDAIFQNNTQVGDRKFTTNKTLLHVKFGLANFVSTEITLPFASEKLAFSNINQMKYDPLSQTGSYLDTPSAEDFIRSGGGMNGVEIGLNFYPMHTKIYSNRGDSGNWQIGMIYRTKDKTNFYTVNEEGKRGSGIGASGLGIQTAFSNKHKFVEPYLFIKAIRSNDFTAPIRDDNGSQIIGDSTYSPAHTVDIRGGTELYVIDDVALASYVTIDLFGAYRYQSFQSIPSGIYLPNVLESTQDTIITQTELVSIQGGLGSNVQINSLYGFRFSGQVGFASPQRVEHIYEVNTNGSLQWGLNAEIRLRYRTTSS